MPALTPEQKRTIANAIAQLGTIAASLDPIKHPATQSVKDALLTHRRELAKANRENCPGPP